MHDDPWTNLRNRTSARIALGRAGGSLGTAACLEFATDHADARDAVYSELDVPLLAAALNQPVLQLRSQAGDRRIYLQRPDLGRRLDDTSAELLKNSAGQPADIALIIGDGLSATAAQRHAVPVVTELHSLLKPTGFRFSQLCIVTQARVAIADQIGSLLNARLSIILLGERPGLGTADSLGAYLTYAPAVGKTDADRNCVSNINSRHLPPAAAAATLFWLVQQSLVRQLSGVRLKDESAPVLTAQAVQPANPPLANN
jgi:ethanolamine ammonia-lyase small subunit